MTGHARFLAGRIGGGELAEVRVRVTAAGFQERDLPWAGRYGENGTHEEPELFRRLLDLATEAAGRSFTLVNFRWRRLRPGDYSLQVDDRDWPRSGADTEVLLDLSERSSEEAEVVWALELQPPWFVMPQRSGGVAVVVREPGVFRYERYLTCRMREREIVRLYLALASKGGA